jgi:thiamine-monophosphate kinase
LLVTGNLGGSISGKHLNFTPRLCEAQWLVRHFKPTAMMDLSDGLGKDLRRLAAASSCGISLERNEIPVTPGCTVGQALGDGEDFELLLAIDPARTDELLAAWPFSGTPLTRIGQLVVVEAGELLAGGWEHFSA